MIHPGNGMEMIFLDTHVVVWLYAGLVGRLSQYAIYLIENHKLCISPMVLLELQYLYEIKKISIAAENIYKDLHLRIGLTVDHTDWTSITKEALKLDWARDPFDRYIMAHALCCDKFLISSDKKMLKKFPLAVFDPI